MEPTQGRKIVSSRWRSLALVLAGVMVGLFLLAPASAHIGTPKHLWKTHIKPRTDARYMPTSIFYRWSSLQSVTSGNFKYVEVACPAGTYVVGGGVSGASSQGADLKQSGPTNGNVQTGFSHWGVNMYGDGVNADFRAFAICLKGGKVQSNYDAGQSLYA